MNTKRNIAERFSRSVDSYHAKAHVQELCAKELIAFAIEANHPNEILEIGCGTGFLTTELLRRYPNSQIEALDFAPKMIQFIQKRLTSNNLTVYLKDIWDFESDKKFDLIASSSTLQWINPLPTLFKKFYSMLKPLSSSGILFSVIVEGTFKELSEIKKAIATNKVETIVLPKVEWIREILDQAGFLIMLQSEKQFISRYDSAWEFLRDIHQIGVTGRNIAGRTQLLTRTELQTLVNMYEARYRNLLGEIEASYNVYFCYAKMRENENSLHSTCSF